MRLFSMLLNNKIKKKAYEMGLYLNSLEFLC